MLEPFRDTPVHLEDRIIWTKTDAVEGPGTRDWELGKTKGHFNLFLNPCLFDCNKWVFQFFSNFFFENSCWRGVPERLFSLFNATYNDDQKSSYTDYIELSMQSQFNERAL